MISGFNTDLEFDGVVYHIQTEDKGARSKMILSLVYDRGTILASKRTKYSEIADGELDDKMISDRLQKQHKLICAAVQAGRIKELKEMTAKTETAAVGTNVESSPVDYSGADEKPSTPAAEYIPPSTPIPLPILELDIAEIFTLPSDDTFEDLFIIEDVDIIEDLEMLTDDAVEVVTELSGRDRPENSNLSIELLGDPRFRGGDRQTVNLMICRGTARKVVSDVQLMIKVLGSSFRPVIFHAKSDANGLARVHLQIPHFDAGRAAMLVRAISDGEEIELRRVITPA